MHKGGLNNNWLRLVENHRLTWWLYTGYNVFQEIKILKNVLVSKV